MHTYTNIEYFGLNKLTLAIQIIKMKWIFNANLAYKISNSFENLAEFENLAIFRGNMILEWLPCEQFLQWNENTASYGCQN